MIIIYSLFIFLLFRYPDFVVILFFLLNIKNFLKFNFSFLILLLYAAILLLSSTNFSIFTLTSIKPVIILLLLFSYPTTFFFKLNFTLITKGFIVLSSIMLIISFIQHGVIVRFPDAVINIFGIISIYYGIVGLIILSSIKGFNYLFFLVLFFVVINGSGTSFLPLIFLIAYKFYYLRIQFLKKLIVFIIGLFVFLFVSFSFFNAQQARGRSVDSVDSIDRVVLVQSSFNYILTLVDDYKKLTFGILPGEEAPIVNFIDNSAILEYILAENDGALFSYQLHNEYFRLLIQFGFIGTFIYIFYFVRLIKNKELKFILFFAAITNLVFSISIIMLFTKIFDTYPYEQKH